MPMLLQTPANSKQERISLDTASQSLCSTSVSLSCCSNLSPTYYSIFKMSLKAQPVRCLADERYPATVAETPGEQHPTLFSGLPLARLPGFCSPLKSQCSKQYFRGFPAQKGPLSIKRCSQYYAKNATVHLSQLHIGP